MLEAAHREFEVVREVFHEASEALSLDLWHLIENGPESELNKTEFTQPAILAASVALYRAWLSAGGSVPDYIAGHSLGEYSALVSLGAISLSEGVKLVRRRGQLMQDAVPVGVGAMAAVLNLDDALVVQCCEKASDVGVVAAVNFNSPGQVVIAGEVGAVEVASGFCKEAGAKRVLPLPVSVPSHCALMTPAADLLMPYLVSALVRPPEVPLIQNVTATEVTSLDSLKNNLVKQLYSPVLWTQSVARLSALGVTHVVECGPGKVLSGLIKRIDKSMTVFDIENPEKLHSTIELMAEKE
ncbi:MAG: ACP S-malonyltransferase [Hahellaceae bacterium]|nr:ACP S-malonyltransferase [Hahellaceae bacterium]